MRCVAGARYIGRGPAPAANGRRSRGSWVGCRRVRLRGQWMRWVAESDPEAAVYASIDFFFYFVFLINIKEINPVKTFF
jgi:hypothetical protein